MNLLKFLSFSLLLSLFACTGTPEVKTDNRTVATASADAKPEILTSFDQLNDRYFQVKDSLVIINFWATWCKPCVRELPDFNEAASKYKGQKVKFVFVSLDFLDTMEKSVVPFIKSNPFNGEVVVLADQDVNTWAINIDNNWDGAIPVTLAIKNGKKSTKMGAFQNYEELNNFIQQNI